MLKNYMVYSYKHSNLSVCSLRRNLRAITGSTGPSGADPSFLFTSSRSLNSQPPRPLTPWLFPPRGLCPAIPLPGTPFPLLSAQLGLFHLQVSITCSVHRGGFPDNLVYCGPTPALHLPTSLCFIVLALIPPWSHFMASWFIFCLSLKWKP